MFNKMLKKFNGIIKEICLCESDLQEQQRILFSMVV